MVKIHCKKCGGKMDTEGLDVELTANDHLFRVHDISPCITAESFDTYFWVVNIP